MSHSDLPIAIVGGRVVSTVDPRSSSPPAVNRAALRELVDSASLGVLVTGADGVIVCANAAAQAMFGGPPLAGRSVDELVPPSLRHAHRVYRSVFAAVPTTRPMARYSHLWAQRADGEAFCVQIELTPFATSEGLWTAAAVRLAPAD
ncbi:MAG: PAS domain-containing protein [Pseudomonadota bacterium]